MSEPFTWKSILSSLASGEHLSFEQSEWFMNDLMDGNASSIPVAAVLASQQALGLTPQEVAGAAKAMVEHAVPLKISGNTTDIVGTGGDHASTVNLSTMGSIAAAAAGVKIVKHGNRAASSKSGAADCLEALGLPLDLHPDDVVAVGEKIGITFAFAKTFHPAMRFAGPIRSELGIPTVFNLLGPLTNPARPAHIAVGVADRTLSPMVSEVFASRHQDGLVFTSHEGLDEMAPTGPVSVWEIRDGEVAVSDFDPVEELGLKKIAVADLRGGMPDFNAQVVRDFLKGKPVSSRETALLNAAAAIVADHSLLSHPQATLTERFQEAYQLAENAVDSGAAAHLLDEWISYAKELKAARA
ncbi:MAG: anthranilate phosphoribosyltransferase [Bifidobacteriaceae bacterium]|jgi:anthranilate phosphoribosyltransferase|nr:anthranilate phosphoribosyltransferase [Bifidobacteriaceae bacterium]MCI1978796.1 anthranilate phosphoribosyltransferase [Bifidobacteriaceae bacterium]